MTHIKQVWLIWWPLHILWHIVNHWLGPNNEWQRKKENKIFSFPFLLCHSLFIYYKHRKNCECCHHHSLFRSHNVNCCSQLSEMLSVSQGSSLRSQVSRTNLWECSLNVIVFVFVIVFLLVRSSLFITRIRCLKGHNSLESLFEDVL